MSVPDGDNQDDLFLIQFFLQEEHVCTQSLMSADFKEPLQTHLCLWCQQFVPDIPVPAAS